MRTTSCSSMSERQIGKKSSDYPRLGEEKARLVVLASGRGRVFAALAEACEKGDMPLEIAGLVASRSNIGAQEVAKRFIIPEVVMNKKDFPTQVEWDAQLCEQIEDWEADWVLLNGYLSLLGPRVLNSYSNRVLNTHPALLPKYGGKGMYGRRVHQAVLAAGEQVTGVTLHLVTSEYDEGPILAQKEVPVKPEDTPETLEARVIEAEKCFVIETLSALCRPQ